MAFALVPGNDPTTDCQLSDDDRAEVLLTPRTPFGGRSRYPAAGAILAVAGLAFVLLAAAGTRVSPLQSTLRGVISRDEIHDCFLNITIRDFKKSGTDGGHDDMLPSRGLVKRGIQKGLVEAELGPDHKPVFVGKTVDEGVTIGLTTKDNFDQWYNDVEGVNKKVFDKIKMNVEGNKLTYTNHHFFPADGKGWNDTDNCSGCAGHNYYFTVEIHQNFTYYGGEVFTFKGDDDIWVYINKQLVVDLGGMHQELDGSVELDTLDLEKGSINEFSLFFAERHPTDSNFGVETSIRLDETVGIKGDESDKQCCVLQFAFFAIVCSPPEDKSWYHFMCN